MRTIIFSIFVAFCSISSYAQGNDLSKMDSLQRNEYLTKLAKEVLINYGPDFYSEKLNVSISRNPEVFYDEWTDHPDIIKHFNRKYYIVTLDNLELKRITKVWIWEDDGEPLRIQFSHNLGRNFFHRSYKDIIRDGGKDIKKECYIPDFPKEKPNLDPDSFYIPAETS